MSRKWIALVLAWVTVATVACTGPQGSAPSGGADLVARQSKTLRMATRDEVADLAPKIPGSSGPNVTKRLFNAFLSLIDSSGTPRPYLAQALPRLNTETWRVFPDGRMETTYRLRDGLTWQDGAPLTAEDFAFAFRVYREPGLGFMGHPESLMEAVLTPDPRTVVIQWRSLYADAGALGIADLVPLPRHLLEVPFAEYTQSGTREALLGRPFWTVEYIGAGPYRVTRWEPGVYLEGEAFDGHALGRAKIDRVILRPITDENAVLANVLAGDQLDYTNTTTLKFEHLPILKREWEAAGKGFVVSDSTSGATTLNVQHRPEYLSEPALLDLRVRRAIAHTLDRPGINEGVFDGIGFMSENFVPDTEPMYQELERVRVKYPFDPQRAGQLMGEAGFARDAGGLFADSTGRRLRLDTIVSAGALAERWQAILADSWRRAGVDVYPSVLSQADSRDVSSRHTFKGLASSGGASEARFLAAEIGSAANRWAGENRGGWSSPEYERLFSSFNSSLDVNERMRYSAQMMTIVNDSVVAYPLFFSIQTRTWVSGLTGPDLGTRGVGLLASPTTVHWNIHEWEFR